MVEYDHENTQIADQRQTRQGADSVSIRGQFRLELRQRLELQTSATHRQVLFPFDIAAYTKGASKSGLSLHSQTIQAITEELVTRRKQFKKAKLNWRVSNPKSAKKSLGWIPFKAAGIKCQNGQIKYAGHWFVCGTAMD